MDSKLIVFGKTSQNLEDILHEHGIFDMLYCYNLEDCLNLCNKVCENVENIVVLCKNNQIDLLVEKLKTADDTLSLINDQAVKMERQTVFKNIYFIPFEADFEKLLQSVLPKKEQFVYSVFGKSEKFLEDKLSVLASEDFKYNIVAKNSFLHIVYSTKPIDKQLFEGGVFSDKNESLASALKYALKSKTLCIADQMSAGSLSFKISRYCKENLISSDLILQENDFEKVGIDKLFLDQNPSASKETVFAVAKNLLKKYKTDFVLVLAGFNCDGGRTFVAAGDLQQINVYSSVFYGSSDEIIENSTNFAIFKTICLINEKEI